VETDPFGNEIGTPIKTVENNLRFPGQYRDEETGLNQNYFRDYDSRTGRYIQADPIGLDGGMNLYGYVLGNPIRFIDPFGLELISFEEGQRIADIARKWKGTPYYPGGGKISSRDKADCSGATWKIYEEAKFPFDYSQSKEFPQNKRFKPSLGNIPQPGDVGQWDGHVLIYDPGSSGFQVGKWSGSMLRPPQWK
jgi:RHS repeat-associated protein